MARDGVPRDHSVYPQGIDSDEIVHTVHYDERPDLSLSGSSPRLRLAPGPQVPDSSNRLRAPPDALLLPPADRRHERES